MAIGKYVIIYFVPRRVDEKGNPVFDFDVYVESDVSQLGANFVAIKKPGDESPSEFISTNIIWRIKTCDELPPDVAAILAAVAAPASP